MPGSSTTPRMTARCERHSCRLYVAAKLTHTASRECADYALSRRHSQIVWCDEVHIVLYYRRNLKENSATTGQPFFFLNSQKKLPKSHHFFLMQSQLEARTWCGNRFQSVLMPSFSSCQLGNTYSTIYQASDRLLSEDAGSARASGRSCAESGD